MRRMIIGLAIATSATVGFVGCGSDSADVSRPVVVDSVFAAYAGAETITAEQCWEDGSCVASAPDGTYVRDAETGQVTFYSGDPRSHPELEHMVRNGTVPVK